MRLAAVLQQIEADPEAAVADRARCDAVERELTAARKALASYRTMESGAFAPTPLGEGAD